MSDTTFVDKSLPLIEASWLNEVNDHLYSDTPVVARAHVHEAATIGVTPTGDVAATNVQTAIAELAAEKARAGANSDITSLSALSTAITLAQGGTGGTTQAMALTALGAALNGVLTKTSTTTVQSTERGKMFDFTTAGCDFNLPTVADGWVNGVRNSASTGVVTLKGAANIDGVAGATGITLNPGESCLVVGSATEWKTVGKQTPHSLITAGTNLVQSPVALNTTTTQAHGLDVEPFYIKTVLECLSSEGEWVTGDRIVISASLMADSNYTTVSGVMVYCNATNVYMKCGNGAPYINFKTSAGGFTITPASWKIVCTPYGLS